MTTLYSSAFGTQTSTFSGLGTTLATAIQADVRQVEGMYTEIINIVRSADGSISDELKQQAYSDYAGFSVWLSRNSGTWREDELEEWRANAVALLNKLVPYKSTSILPIVCALGVGALVVGAFFAIASNKKKR